MTAGRREETQRVFFALWPDPAVRAGLATLAADVYAACGGRPTRTDTLHQTLVFIGGIPDARIDDLIAAAESLRGEGFKTVFDRVECWPRNRLAAAIPTAPPSALCTLIGALENRLESAGFSYDRRPARPHVTLIRKADCAAYGTTHRTAEPPIFAPIAWAARDFVLVASTLGPAGPDYTILKRFPLGG